MIRELGEFFEWFKAAFSGWRYLFSASYRKSKHQDWKHENTIYIVLDFIGGIAGIAFSVAAIYFCVIILKTL